jgi:hypothetical protein
LLGWYRIGNDLGPLPANGKVGDLDDDETYCLHLVENATSWVALEVEGRRVRWNIGMAVPVASLVDAAVHEFHLSDQPWQLWCGDRRFDDFEVLADHPDGLVHGLVLRSGAG